MLSIYTLAVRRSTCGGGASQRNSLGTGISARQVRIGFWLTLHLNGWCQAQTLFGPGHRKSPGLGQQKHGLVAENRKLSLCEGETINCSLLFSSAPHQSSNRPLTDGIGDPTDCGFRRIILYRQSDPSTVEESFNLRHCTTMRCETHGT